MGNHIKCARTGGQAMIELMVGLVAVVALVAGLLQVASLTRVHTDTMVEARTEAGMNAVSMLYHSDDAEYIRDWEEGADTKAYTRDDEFTEGDSSRFVHTIVDRAGNTESDWETLGRVPNNQISLLRGGHEPSRAFGLVRGHATDEVELLPAVRSLLYRAESIEVEGEVWMTWTTGIY